MKPHGGLIVNVVAERRSEGGQEEKDEQANRPPHPEVTYATSLFAVVHCRCRELLDGANCLAQVTG